MPVTGMGGYFFRAKDPAALKVWYREHLGVGGGMGEDPATGHSNEWVWYQEGGPTGVHSWLLYAAEAQAKGAEASPLRDGG